MNLVDSALSDTADYLQAMIRNNPELARALAALVTADNKPQLVRELRNQPPGTHCLIVIGDTLVG